MEITREDLEKRLAQLREQMKVLQSDMDATFGAIQDCEHWLTVLAGNPKEAGNDG